MHCKSSVRRPMRSLAAALSLLACAGAAYGADTYNGGVLQIPTLGIGSATFANVELTISLPLIRAPNGSMAVGTEDTYDPANNQLVVPAVKVGSSTFYNAVVAVDKLTSIGSVSGADTFDGTNLILRNVQVGAQSYHDVTLHVGLANVASVGGGMPGVSADQFDAATGQLTIGAVLVGTKVYTNVILHVGLSNVASIAGYAERVLYGFEGGADGNDPAASLIMDASGNLYGTTSGVGSSGVFGTVFKLTPNGSGGYTESVLHSFASFPNDGGNPLAGLVMDSGGNLYGTTTAGGTADWGTVFKLTSNGNGGYTESVLYSFLGGTVDAWYPRAALLLDAHGNLYGTTQFGGNAGSGAVFELTANGAGGYTERVLYSFLGGSDGEGPEAGLISDANGNLYGTTDLGGSAFAGTVFKLTPNGNGGYTESVLYNFADEANGGDPLGGLVMDANGILYGTTSGGGNLNGGTVFKLSANGEGGYTETVLHNFGGEVDGVGPDAGLILDASGNLYGTTGIAGSADGGIVFKLTPGGDGAYTESVLYSFLRSPDGNEPEASLIMDPSGNLFGTTTAGGSTNNGVVFEIH
jgi:uncharacterized repeat protein (TIGR03803 family)